MAEVDLLNSSNVFSKGNDKFDPSDWTSVNNAVLVFQNLMPRSGLHEGNCESFENSFLKDTVKHHIWFN